jgi:mRNA interferase MazF
MICPGEIWVADIPFTGGQGSKPRPVLVLWLDGVDCVIASVTSALPRSPADVPLLDWKLAGLRVPSTVRLSRLDTLEQSLLWHRIGVLSVADGTRVKGIWDLQIKPAF